ncbi:MAG: cation:proton antiporter [Victivallaceae bacterium]|nr:cation:proton antiporter [Victivallaceae bacterium]
MFPLSDPILTFTILALMIFISPLLAGRLKIPDLVLLLLGGALLGPNGLGVIERNSAITMFGAIGLLYIMFIAGLEIDLNRFMRTRNRSIVFGLITFSIPEGIGTVAGHYLLGFDWTTSILLASMFASHTLLAYPIASRFGIVRSEPVVITVGGTIITDTLALLVLAVIADSVRGTALGAGFWLTLVLGIGTLVAIIFLGVPWLTRWFFKNVTESGGAQFLFVIVMVCGCAYLSHFAKMEPIIGAFLMGAVFNRLIPEQSALMNRLVFVGNTLFIPFFLISVGMLVNPRVMVASPRSWLVTAVMVICVIGTKYAAARLTRKIFGYGAAAGNVIFGLSVVQAAATLAAVIVGYNLRIFDETVLNGAVAMILVTCPLGAWMVDRYGRGLAGQEPVQRELAPTEQRLMVSIANPATALRLLNLAFLIRDRNRHGSICPVNIVCDQDNTDEAVAGGEKLLTACLAESASAGMEISPSVRFDLNPSDGMIRTAKELRATQLIAGLSQKQQLEAHLFGTVSENLLESCPSRLLFCRLVRPLNITKRILIPFPALSERRTDLAALLHDAKHLAKQIGAMLQIYMISEGGAKLKHAIDTAKPTCPTAVVEAKTWSAVQSMLLGDITEDDLVLIPGERHAGIFWTPALARLQEIVFNRFPEINLLCAYPRVPSHNEAGLYQPHSSRAKPAMIPVDIPGETTCQNGLRLMAEDAFSYDETVLRDVIALLLKAADAYPLELAAGVVLVHAHCDSISSPVIIVGRTGRDWRFRNLNGEYRVIVVLLSPALAPPEQHLKILADLARTFLDRNLLLQVQSSGSAEEIVRLLSKR